MERHTIIGNTRPASEIDRSLVDKLNEEAKHAPPETYEAPPAEPAPTPEARPEAKAFEEVGELMLRFGTYDSFREEGIRIATFADLYRTSKALKEFEDGWDRDVAREAKKRMQNLRDDLRMGVLFATHLHYRMDGNVVISEETPNGVYINNRVSKTPSFNEENIHEAIMDFTGGCFLNSICRQPHETTGGKRAFFQYLGGTREVRLKVRGDFLGLGIVGRPGKRMVSAQADIGRLIIDCDTEPERFGTVFEYRGKE